MIVKLLGWSPSFDRLKFSCKITITEMKMSSEPYAKVN